MTQEQTNRVVVELEIMEAKREKIEKEMALTFKTIILYPEDAKNKMHWIEEGAEKLAEIQTHIEKLHTMIKS